MSTQRPPRSVGRGAIGHQGGWGVAIAATTALVSGFAVFLNGYGVRRFAGTSPATYTTMKNLVAAGLLLGLLLAAPARGSGSGWTPPRTRYERLSLLVVGVLGGGVAFLLFFEGLARASSVDAAFVHKTLVVWVAVLALPLLHERLGILHVGAIALVVVGQVELTTDFGAFRMGSGEWMILGATLLWALEVVIAKRLLSTLSPLTVGTARLVIGCGVLLAWLAATGHVTQLVEATGEQWLWASYTGVVLTAYVATWFAALARAQAVDVTAVLVLGAVVTALLGAVVEGNPLRPQATGLALIFVGVVGIAIAALRARPARELTPA